MTRRLPPTCARWFNGLTEQEFEQVSQDLCFEVIEAQELACRDGEPALWWMGVVDGLLVITKDYADGRRTTLTGMLPGVWFGEGTLAKRDIWRYDARALRRTTIAKLPIATFEWLLNRSIPFNRFIFDQVNERLGQFVEGREIDRSNESNAKVARNLSLLFSQARYASWGDQIRITQEELASLCGLSRQRVNQALRVLEGCMFVKTTYGRIQVLDLDGLRSRLLDFQPLSAAIRSDTANRKNNVLRRTSAMSLEDRVIGSPAESIEIGDQSTRLAGECVR